MARKQPTVRYGERAEKVLGVETNKRREVFIPLGLGSSKQKIAGILPKIDAAKAKNAELRRKREKKG